MVQTNFMFEIVYDDAIYMPLVYLLSTIPFHVHLPGSSTSDLFIIKSIQMYLADSACTWLEHLPRGRINNWA
jgi:uncharacterized membrane protein YpjA